MSKADQAEQLFRSGYNCAQSVLGAFAAEVGLTEEQALLLASPFGAGIGKLRGVCGAVSGMTMVLGLTHGYSSPTDAEGKQAVYRRTRELIHRFEQLQGSSVCRELLGLTEGEDPPEPAARTEAYYRERPCLGAVRCAAGLIESYLREQGGR